MKPAVIDILKQIASGVTIYEPFGRTPHDLQKFQDIVIRLQEAEREGLVKQLFLQYRAGHQGEDQIELVMVQGGLTDAGEKIMKENSCTSSRARHPYFEWDFSRDLFRYPQDKLFRPRSDSTARRPELLQSYCNLNPP